MFHVVVPDNSLTIHAKTMQACGCPKPVAEGIARCEKPFSGCRTARTSNGLALSLTLMLYRYVAAAVLAAAHLERNVALPYPSICTVRTAHHGSGSSASSCLAVSGGPLQKNARLNARVGQNGKFQRSDTCRVSTAIPIELQRQACSLHRLKGQ